MKDDYVTSRGPVTLLLTDGRVIQGTRPAEGGYGYLGPIAAGTTEFDRAHVLWMGGEWRRFDPSSVLSIHFSPPQPESE